MSHCPYCAAHVESAAPATSTDPIPFDPKIDRCVVEVDRAKWIALQRAIQRLQFAESIDKAFAP